MNKRRKLFIDFDMTICNAIKAIVDLYNADFRLYKNYRKIHWTDIYHYNFKELSLIDEYKIMEYFDDHRFFETVEPMDNAFEVLDKLNSKYDLYICSLGRKQNLKYKKAWCETNIPYANFIGIDYDKYSDKSCIDMSGGIILDDNLKMLDSSNSEVKLIFGDIYEHNCNNINMYHRCYNWTDVERLLLI